MVLLHYRIATEDASLSEILDRILDKGIVLEPSVRVISGVIDFRASGKHVVVAPERRHKPFIIPTKKLMP